MYLLKLMGHGLIYLQTLVAKKESSGLAHIHMNSWPGDLTAGDGGIAALPDRTQEFR